MPNPERLLRPGFFAKGELVYDPHGDAVVVPEKALTTFAGVTKLFVVDGRQGRGAHRPHRRRRSTTAARSPTA